MLKEHNDMWIEGGLTIDMLKGYGDRGIGVDNNGKIIPFSQTGNSTQYPGKCLFVSPTFTAVGVFYLSITDAIQAANDNDTIIIYSGVYQESVTIDKMLAIIGIGRIIIGGNITVQGTMSNYYIDAPLLSCDLITIDSASFCDYFHIHSCDRLRNQNSGILRNFIACKIDEINLDGTLSLDKYDIDLVGYLRIRGSKSAILHSDNIVGQIIVEDCAHLTISKAHLYQDTMPSLIINGENAIVKIEDSSFHADNCSWGSIVEITNALGVQLKNVVFCGDASTNCKAIESVGGNVDIMVSGGCVSNLPISNVTEIGNTITINQNFKNYNI